MNHPPDSAYGLWYYAKINRFVDENNNILHDFHELFDIWQLEKWKKTKKYGILTDRNGDLCELYYLDSYYGPECDHNCESCMLKPCQIYDLWKDWRIERSYI